MSASDSPSSPASTPIVPTPPDDGAGSPAVAQSRQLSATFDSRPWLKLLIVVTTFLALVFAVGVAVHLLSYISHTLLLFALGGLLAYAFDPIVEWIRMRTSGKRWLGVMILFVLLIGVVVLAIILLSKELIYQVETLARQHTQIQTAAEQKLADLDGWLAARNIRVDLQQYITHPPAGVKTWGEAVAHHVAGWLAHAAGSVVEGIIVLLITLYFLIYSREMHEGFDRALPARLRPYALQWQSDANHILGGFVRGQAVLALVLGAAATVGCLLLGVHYWLLIGLFVVFASLIPVFGPYIGAAPAIVSALLTPGGAILTPVVRAVLVLLLFIVINEGGSKILYPRLVGSALGLHEVIVLFVLFAGLEVGHIWGVLFAAPLTALAIVTVVQLYRFWQGEPPVSITQIMNKGGIRAEEHGTP